MKQSSQQTTPRKLLTLKTAPPFAHAGNKGHARKPRQFVSLEASLYDSIKKGKRRNPNTEGTFQSAAAISVGGVYDVWGSVKEAFIFQPRRNGKGLKKTRLRLNLKPPRIKIFGKPGPKPLPHTREEKEQIEKQQSRARRQKFEDGTRMTKKKIRQTIHTARIKLPRTTTRGPGHRQEAIQEIVDKALKPYLNSKKGYERKAAKEVKAQQQRKLSGLNM